jgi:integrase
MIRARCDGAGCKKYIKRKETKCPFCGSSKRVYYVVVGGVSTFAGDSLTAAKEKDAKLKRAKRLGHLEEYSTPEHILFKDFIESDFKPYFMNKNRTEPRLSHIKFFTDLFGNRDMRSIRQDEIIRAINHIANTRAVATRNRYLATIKGIFTCALKSGKIDKHPAKIPALIEDNERIRYLTYKEEEQLLPLCKKVRIDDAFLIGLYTGMRRSEIMTLSQEDIKDGKIHIKAKYSKSKRGRIIPIHGKIAEIMKGDLKFRYRFDHKFSKIAKDLNLKDVTFHTLRHTFASRLVMKGVDIFSVSRLMGHENIKTTQRYAHLAPEYFEGTIDKL